MNRILQYLACPCELRRRRKAAAEAVCERLKELAGEFINVSVRSLDPDDDQIHFAVIMELEPTSNLDHAAAHLAAELRRASDELLYAAGMLEGGAA